MRFNLRKWSFDGRPLANPLRIVQRVVFVLLAFPFGILCAALLFCGGFGDAAKSVFWEIKFW